MTVKLDAETVVELIKGYFQDNEFEPVCLKEGETFKFCFNFNCIEGVTFLLEELELPEE